MNPPLVKVAVQGGIAELTLARPHKRNALTRDLITQFTHAVRTIHADKAVRVLTIAAEGTAFCAGMDLEEMQQRAQAADARSQWEKDARDYRDMLLSILMLDVPTLAIVQGPAIAGGFGIVLACDFVLASRSALFALPELKRGISPAVVSPLLVYRIGNGAAMPLLLAGRTLDGDEARRLGICHQVVPPDKLDAARNEWLNGLLENAPEAIATTKKLVRSFEERALIERLEAGMKVSAQARETTEAREGLSAFLQKRRPTWSRRFDST
jgi:methylglutaconyl-CoA hydratase